VSRQTLDLDDARKAGSPPPIELVALTPRREQWRVLMPPGTVSLDMPMSPFARRRILKQARALPPNTVVALCDANPGSRWRCRRFARRAGIRIDREYLAIPFIHSPTYYIQDTSEAIHYFCVELFTVSRGNPVMALGARSLIAVAQALSLWRLVGAVVPPRITVGAMP
jgi:hypothetical protein